MERQAIKAKKIIRKILTIIASIEEEYNINEAPFL